MKAYDVVFLDLDHTLVDTQGQYRLGLAKTIDALYEGRIPDGWIESFMSHHHELWAQYDKREITMLELRRERFLRAWQDFDVERTVAQADEFHTAYDATFETTLFPYPETLDLVAELARHHRLGIITNGSPDLQDRKMRIAGLGKYFAPETVIVSELVGMAKPHPSVYQTACKQLGVNVQDAVMIGDNYRADVEGARAFGMDAIWYVPDPDMAVRAAEKMGIEPTTTKAQVLDLLHQLEEAR